LEVAVASSGFLPIGVPARCAASSRAQASSRKRSSGDISVVCAVVGVMDASARNGGVRCSVSGFWERLPSPMRLAISLPALVADSASRSCWVARRPTPCRVATPYAMAPSSSEHQQRGKAGAAVQAGWLRRRRAHFQRGVLYRLS
jgi:hypothetical protein